MLVSTAARPVAAGLSGQNCCDVQHRCFTFGPPPGGEVGKIDTGGAWRSNLRTTQLGLQVLPGADIRIDVNLLAMRRRGTATQLGEYEADVVVGKKFKSGVYASAGYGIDNDERQVGYFQVTVNF